MAVPRKKLSKWAKGKRRSHLALTALNFSNCSNCGAHRLPHSVCDFCGFYKGKQIYNTKFAPMIKAAQQQAAAQQAAAVEPAK